MSSLIASLSPTQSLVRSTVLRFRQASTSQLRRLHYSGTDRGTRVRCSDHLKKLHERGVIRRLPYKLSGWGRGSGEFVYGPPDSTRRVPDLHTLDVTELYIRLVEHTQSADSVTYEPEPWATKTWGGFKVTPDAYIRLPGRHYFAEMDLGSEEPSVISAKMNRYVNAYRGLDGGTFPQVLWLAHDVDRIRLLQREAKKKGEAELFVCLLFDDAVEFMTN